MQKRRWPVQPGWRLLLDFGEPTVCPRTVARSASGFLPATELCDDGDVRGWSWSCPGATPERLCSARRSEPAARGGCGAVPDYRRTPRGRGASASANTVDRAGATASFSSGVQAASRAELRFGTTPRRKRTFVASGQTGARVGQPTPSQPTVVDPDPSGRVNGEFRARRTDRAVRP